MFFCTCIIDGTCDMLFFASVASIDSTDATDCVYGGPWLMYISFMFGKWWFMCIPRKNCWICVCFFSNRCW